MSKCKPFARRGITTCLALFGMLTTGCSDGPTAVEVRTASTVNRPAIEGTFGSRLEQIDAALAAAADFLTARQSPDGAWRSSVYGPFKEGDALTATVANALLDSSNALGKDRQQPAIDRAIDYLASMVGDDGNIEAPPHGLAYPTYTAAGAVIALSRNGGPEYAAARDAWLAYLRDRQLAEPLGWTEDDPEYGGWGYAADPPRKPAPGVPLGNLAEPNLSATVFALSALRAAGAGDDDPAIRKALSFVRRCQNVADDEAQRDARFDDGGFHFMLGDPVRNKAGVAGVDRDGRTRFASYGSTTADGLQTLHLCGTADDDPGVTAAWRWFDLNFSADEHPGGYATDREGARGAVYFYYSDSLAHALAAKPNNAVDEATRLSWAGAMADALLSRQAVDGSWSNTAVDVREDDPLVATSLAASALVRYRAIIVASGETSKALR